MGWYEELDREFDERDRYIRTIRKLQKELDNLYTINASNSVKAQYVFRCLRHLEVIAMKCPTCGAERDEDGILHHKKNCYLANALENANE